MSSYIVMFVGIFFGAVVILFGSICTTVFSDNAVLIQDSLVCEYQYVLKDTVETSDSEAEKYAIKSFDFDYENYLKDEISVYGICENSKYIDTDVSGDKAVISKTIAVKYGLGEGDSITLYDPYSKNKNFTFTISGVYDYQASHAVFINLERFNRTFDNDEDYFTGYFSNREIDDISDEYIANVVTPEDYAKLTEQLQRSIGDIMVVFKYFGVVMFVLIMYILSKQVIEKNFQSISMCKILGFKNGEISKLYILSTSIVVVLSLLISIPISNCILEWAFGSYIYTMLTGYIPYIVHVSNFVEMVILGVVSYAIVAAFQMIKINRIPKSEALKNRE